MSGDTVGLVVVKGGRIQIVRVPCAKDCVAKGVMTTAKALERKIDETRKQYCDRPQSCSEELQSFYDTVNAKADICLSQETTASHWLQENANTASDDTRLQTFYDKAFQRKQETVNTTMMIEELSKEMAEKQASRKETAESYLKDAKASLRMLEGKTEILHIMERQLRQCEESYTHGMYQTCIASAMDVISTTKKQYLSWMRQKVEKDMIRMELQSRLEGIKALLDEANEVIVEDPETLEETREEIDKYVHGRYKETCKKVIELAGIIDACDDTYSLMRTMDNVQKLEKEVEKMLQTGYANMESFYQRRHVLQLLTEYMETQGYEVDWAACEGKDATGKLVYHFQSVFDNNSISLTVSDESTGNMSMEMMMFYTDGHEIAEDEKAAMRRDMEYVLHNEGYSASLSCAGRHGQSSKQLEYDDFESVERKVTNGRI